MPVGTHPPAFSLPPISEAEVPFSSLFDSGFDLDTVQATAQLAHKSIFVTSDGRRFLFESLPDRNVQEVPRTYDPLHAPLEQIPLPSANFQYHQSFQDTARFRSVSNAQATYPLPVRQGPHSHQRTIHHEPRVPTQDVTTVMRHHSISRFGATSLYGESDGGAQAAETLTNAYQGHQPANPFPPAMAPVQQVPRTFFHEVYQDPNGTQASSFSSRITNFDYGSYMAQVQGQGQDARQSVASSGTLPSLMEYSSPTVSSMPRDSTCFVPVSPASPFEEHMASKLPQLQVNGAPPSVMDPSVVAKSQLYTKAGSGIGANNCIDTQAAVVVIQSQQLQPQPTSSDEGSMNREGVGPGEDVLFDGPVKSSQMLSSPNFMDGQLKVFRNNLSDELRFHCRVGYDSETYWMKGANAQLIPVYAYDQRFPNVVYIRDIANDKSNNHSYTQQNPQATGRPSGIYQFAKLADLCNFQAKLTGEKVVLDIASVRFVRLSRMNSRASDTYSSVRVQIWHEAGARRGNGAQSDVASFVTAGTTLSGPLRERLVPQSSRLVVYLGRMSEYITAFITDDIEIKPEGQTMVKLKVRKAGPFSKKGARWPGIKVRHVPKQGADPAGLDIHGQTSCPDVEASYDLYKTFEMDFESSPSQDNFLRKWDEVIKERRAQRRRLDQIQEGMEQATFTGRTARELW